MARLIGIRHRRKRTTEDEERPTTVAIKFGDKVVCHDLETETDELDFLLHRFPVEWKDVEDQDVVWFDEKTAPDGVKPHHCKWKTIKPKEALLVKANHLRRRANGSYQKVTKLPSKFGGLEKDDQIAMVLGGSGDRFAFALSRQGESMEACVHRIPPSVLKQYRDEKKQDKDDDHKTLLELLEEKPGFFQTLTVRGRALIQVNEAFRARQEITKARIGCQQRLYQSLVGRIFLSEEGQYPEGVIEDTFNALKASDEILGVLVLEEERRWAEMERAVQALEIWRKIFAPVTGCGVRIAAGLISAIGSIMRFVVPPDKKSPYSEKELAGWESHKIGRPKSGRKVFDLHHYVHQLRRNKAKMKTLAKVEAFCGVHVLPDGTQPRRRSGQVANWNPVARQSLYLLGGQFNRRPDSVWGKKLRENKTLVKTKHPEPVNVEVEAKSRNGKVKKTVQRYTPGHIQKMALWYTLRQFVIFMTREWIRVEKSWETNGDTDAPNSGDELRAPETLMEKVD